MRCFRLAAVLTLVSFVVDANGVQGSDSFAPLEQWKAAVVSGNNPALAAFYAKVPPPEIWVARNKVKSAETLNDELAFWAGLSSSHVGSLNVKVLSLETAKNQTKLTLRLECLKENQPVFFRMFQTWIEQGERWQIIFSLRTDFFPDIKSRLPEPTKPDPVLYPDPRQAQAELTAAFAAAGGQNKRVLAVFGGNWCYDCHVLEATFNSPEFISLVRANYIVVHINIGGEGKDNNDLAARFRVNLDRGVPSLAVLDPNGEIIVSQQNGEFKSTVKIGPEDVRTFLERWKPARQ